MFDGKTCVFGGYLWVESRICFLLCGASPPPGGQSGGSLRWFHLREQKQRNDGEAEGNTGRLVRKRKSRAVWWHPAVQLRLLYLRLYQGADRLRTPCGRSARCVHRSGGGNSWWSWGLQGHPGCRGRRRGDCRRWGRGRSVLRGKNGVQFSRPLTWREHRD